MHNRIKGYWKWIPSDEPGGRWEAGPGRQWREAQARFLAAVDPQQRAAVRALLGRLPAASLGLHAWLCALAWEAAFLPARIPGEVVRVYLEDAEAAPLAECADCGLALPVRPGRRDDQGWGQDYFPTCPACGGRPGWCGLAGAAGESAGPPFRSP
jgi:hypothetical protein